MDPLQKAYDEIPYPRLCFNQTHPSRLAAIATLLGLTPAPPDHSRVLELGCGGGDNLIPMAAALPQSHFVGIDLSPVQIARGQAEIDALGLTNIRLLAADIRTWGDAEAPYDYIIAHGLYSWVSPPVADRLLALCGALLAPHGVAYVSYNTLPGWHRTLQLREMLRHQLRREPDRRRWPDLVREYVTFLSDAVDRMAPPPEQAHGQFLGTYSSLLAEYRRSVVASEQPYRDVLMLHDELGEENNPVYFHQFADRAADHGLQYLAEADFPQVMPGNLPHNLGRALGRFADNVLEMEQQMDFLRNRTFRQTLLCRAQAPLDRGLDPARLAGLGVSTRATLSSIDPENGLVTFKGDDGALFRSDHPLTRSAFFYLAQAAPQIIPFTTLVSVAASYAYPEIPLPQEMAADVNQLAEQSAAGLQLQPAAGGAARGDGADCAGGGRPAGGLCPGPPAGGRAGPRRQFAS